MTLLVYYSKKITSNLIVSMRIFICALQRGLICQTLGTEWRGQHHCIWDATVDPWHCESFVQKLRATDSESHVEEQIQTQERNNLWPAHHTPSTTRSLHFIILRHTRLAKPRNDLIEMLAVPPRLGCSQGS